MRLMMNRNYVSDIRNELIILKEETKPDDMIEIVNASFIADEPTIFGKVNENYIQREFKWYVSQSLNVYDFDGTVPQIWADIAAKDGSINSNYGWCQFSISNGCQYDKAITNLRNNLNSRQGAMIFTRPSMHEDAIENGRSDFMCTYAHQIMFRDGKLNYHVFMRSNDVIFGYNNDKAWADYIHQLAADDLGVEKGVMYWNAASLHVYPRHHQLVVADG